MNGYQTPWVLCCRETAFVADTRGGLVELRGPADRVTQLGVGAGDAPAANVDDSVFYVGYLLTPATRGAERVHKKEPGFPWPLISVTVNLDGRPSRSKGLQAEDLTP